MMIYGLKTNQLLIFLVAWIAYGSTYLMRKPHGVVKSDIQKDLGLSVSELGWMDTALILPYATIQMLFGQVTDILGARRTFGSALMIAGISMISFGSWSSYPVLLCLLCINGSAESLCWPSCTKVLASWFHSSTRNTMFGLLGTCGYVGGILSTALTVYLQAEYGWRHVFFLPSLICILMGVLVLWTFCDASESQGNHPEMFPHAENTKCPEGTPSKSKKISWFQLWTLRLVPELAIAVFCLKLVRYAIYLWMPMYLLHHLRYSQTEAGLFSTMFEIGGIIGCLLIGAFINRIFCGRALLGSTVGFIISGLSLLAFIVTSQWGTWMNSGLMLMVGVFNCGPDIILTGTVPYEIGDKHGSAAAVAGLINGFGTLGSVIQGPVIGYVVERFGWESLFACLTAASAVGRGPG